MRKQKISSIEENVEYWAKNELEAGDVKLYAKTDNINDSIESALKSAPSKSGGDGGNFPDIKFLADLPDRKDAIPVMCEVKGEKGRLVKYAKDGVTIANTTAKGDPSWKNISGFAVNGAVHYARAVIDRGAAVECIAVGINGYMEQDGTEHHEFGAYYLSKDNGSLVKQIPLGSLKDFHPAYSAELAEAISSLGLTTAERAKLAADAEAEMDDRLKRLNQMMHDDLNLSVSARVPLVCGMIMAGLSVPDDGLKPLSPDELRGVDPKRNGSDGNILIDQIDNYLSAKHLPHAKRELVVRILRTTFLNDSLQVANDGESILKRLYREVVADIVPYVDSAKAGFLDFSGKLFNVLTEWVDIPDGGANDVVLTPRYVTDMMARVCEVGRDDYVWDYALGTAGFLVSSLKLMLADADKIPDPEERERKKMQIRAEQLLGIEKREDIYMLAVLNMVLMGDGSSNIIRADSLQWDGTYEQGDRAGEEFKASVFLLNPPYSAAGKGLVFVEKALSRMAKGGRAAVLIQENAGSGNGLPYAAKILENNTLKAVVHMADIFKGKAGVQTAVYVFDVGVPHDTKKLVTFIDMSEDGYTRQNRKKASFSTNLRDTDHAADRYAEVVDIICGNLKHTDYYKEGEHVFRDTIGLTGDDWTVNQHRKYDTVPTEEDFKKVVADYLAWKVGAILKGEMTLEEATR